MFFCPKITAISQRAKKKIGDNAVFECICMCICIRWSWYGTKREKKTIPWFMVNEAPAIPLGSCFAQILSPKTIRIHNVSHNGQNYPWTFCYWFAILCCCWCYCCCWASNPKRQHFHKVAQSKEHRGPAYTLYTYTLTYSIISHWILWAWPS